MKSPGCCHDCHFRFEEKYAFPHLPAGARKALKREHENLKRTNYREADIESHIAREMSIFRLWVPAPIVREIARQHKELKKVKSNGLN